MNARLEITPNGYFVAQASQVGTTDEEMLAFTKSELPEDRIRLVAGRLQLAAVALSQMIPQGRC